MIKITKQCTNCGRDINRVKSDFNKSGRQYCCFECEKEYKHKQYYEIRKCEICGKEFECRKTSTQRFCNTTCQGKWQSTQLGEINPRFSQEKVACEWCGKLHYQKQYKINNNQSCFCSEQCSRKWFSEVWSQTDEVKDASRERAVDMLESGAFNHTNTGCQIILNNLLDNMHIKYINEKNIDNFYSVDNYLIDYDLIIEVMGTYWHCDPRKYKEVNYANQYNRIIKDKAKHTHVKNKGIEILYLWEYDLNNNIGMCEEMIKAYINNEIVEFHSFNHNNKIRIKPYQEYNSSELNRIVDLTVKEKLSNKDESKWIEYKCECCGKDCNELLSKYNKNKTHCCSRNCASKLQSLNNIKVVCENCNKSFDVTPSVYSLNKSKKFCCSTKCRKKYLMINNTVSFECDNCNKEVTVGLADYNKTNSDNHFCCRECYNEFRKTIRENQIKITNKVKKEVEIFKDGVSLGKFESVSELSRQSEELFGVKLSGCKISEVCNNKRKHHKKYTFKYVN